MLCVFWTDIFILENGIMLWQHHHLLLIFTHRSDKQSLPDDGEVCESCHRGGTSCGRASHMLSTVDIHPVLGKKKIRTSLLFAHIYIALCIAIVDVLL